MEAARAELREEEDKESRAGSMWEKMRAAVNWRGGSRSEDAGKKEFRHESMWGKLSSVVKAKGLSPWQPNKVGKLDMRISRMPSPSQSKIDRPVSVSTLNRNPMHLGSSSQRQRRPSSREVIRAASSQRQRRPSSREVIRAAENAKMATVKEGIQLVSVRSSATDKSNYGQPVSRRKPTLENLAAATKTSLQNDVNTHERVLSL